MPQGTHGRRQLPVRAGFLFLVLGAGIVSRPRELFAADFIRADANGDGAVNVADPIALLRLLFLGERGRGLSCLDALDVNDDGQWDIADVVAALFFLFKGGAAPPAPGLRCGPDPTPDPLGCVAFEPCPRGNEAPLAAFTASVDRGEAPLEIAFDASASVDPDGRIERFQWDFGDGGTSSGAFVAHTFSAVGSFAVVLTVSDELGAQATAQRSIEVVGIRPTFIRETSPADGEVNVAVTRETILRFSLPIRAASVTPEAIFAEFAGELLAGRLHSAAGLATVDTVTLFYDPPLPSSARVLVTVDGNQLLDAEGQAVDADGDGQPGGAATIVFDTLSLTLVPGTAVCGRVFASELGDMQGASVNVPLAGVLISVDGTADTVFAFSDATGDFRLEPAPSGLFFVHIDGRRVTGRFPAGDYYPIVGKAWDGVPGEETNVGEIYLPLITSGTLRPVSRTEDVVINFPDIVLVEHPELAGVSLTVPAGSLYDNDGTPGAGVGIAPVPPDRLPGPLPEGLEFPLVITVQTDGAENFNTPVPVCFPNLPDPATDVALAPGAKSALWSFNHDTGQWEVIGSMTVSADGRLVCTDPGVGILAPGWHGVNPGSQVEGGEVGESTDDEREEGQHTSSYPPKNDDEDADATCAFGCKVYLHSGEEHFSRVDLAIPGRGDIHFTMSRTYRSHFDYRGPLGFGWDFAYNESLFPKDGGAVVRASGSGYRDRWERTAGGGFQAPAGDFRGMLREPDGSFTLRAPDGFKRRYHPDGRLQAHIDRFGNTMIFEYDARGNLDLVIDAYGREIDFVFERFPDGVDRLVKLRDFIGREVVYTYDGRGDLVAVRTPIVTGTSTGNNFPQGRSERYSYSFGFADLRLNHNLLSVTYPEEVANGGPPALTWVYGTNPADPGTFDRVLEESLGGGRINASGIPAGGTTRFIYKTRRFGEPLTEPDVPRAVGMVTIIERNGRIYEYFADERRHHIETRRLTRPMDEAGRPRFEHRDDLPAGLDFYQTQSFFDGDGQLVRRIFPEGNEVRYRYGSGARGANRNLVELRRIAGPRGDGKGGPAEDLVTTFSYEPLHNQVASVTDPRGNSPSYTPPIGVASAARYTTRFFFDYQEGTGPIADGERFGIDISGFPRGLGDLNGDGRTDQSAGHVVRSESPTVTLPADSNEAARRGTTAQRILTETQWNDHGQVRRRIDPEGNVTLFERYPENDPDGDGVVVASLFKALNRLDASGYPRSITIDAESSPRRSASAAPAALRSRFSYDPVGNRNAFENPRGVLTRIEVNPLNEPVVVTRGAEVAAAAAAGQLPTGEAPFRYVLRRFYDHDGRVVRGETEDRAEVSTTAGVGAFVEDRFTYDLLGKLVERNAELDSLTTLTWRFRYDPAQLLTQTIEPEGNEHLLTYDERQMPFEVTRGFGSPEARTTRLHYDRNSNTQRLRDGEDNDGDGEPEHAEYVYDGFDRRVAAFDRLRNEVRCDYDPAGHRLSELFLGHRPGDPLGPKTRLFERFRLHDELGRVFQVDDALFLADGFVTNRPVELRDQSSDGLVTTRHEFDALSRRTFLIEDDLELHQAVYDGASRIVETADAVGNVQRIRYDRNSNPLELRSIEVSPEGLVADEVFSTLYVWDQLDRLVRVTDNAGQTTRFGYDSRDNLVLRSDPEGGLIPDPLGLFPPDPPVAGQPETINAPGNSKTYFYDGLNRRVREVADLRVGGMGGEPLDPSNPTNPDGRLTMSFEWNGNSRLAAMTDDNGNVSQYRYDALNRLTALIHADGTSSAFTYDRDYNLTRIVDPNGSVIRRTFDALDRPVRCEVDNRAAPSVVGTTLETYEYDGFSRLTKATDDNGASADAQVWELAYDSLSRILEERQNGHAVSSVYTGDSKRLRCIYPGGRTISHIHDAIDRVTAIGDAAGPIAESAWIGPGYRELRRRCGNGTTLTFLDDSESQDLGYDLVKRVVAMRCLLPSGEPFLERVCSYNRADMRSEETRFDDGGLSDRFAYDSVYRLVSARFDAGGAGGAVRRRVGSIDYVLDGAGNRRKVREETTDGGSSTSSLSVNEMNEYLSRDGIDQVHDDNGNLRDDGQRLMAFDYRNRLVEVRDAQSGAPIAKYSYLANGRRSRKVVFSRERPGEVEKETQFLYDGAQVCEERDGATGAVEATYVWSPVYIDELVQMERGGQRLTIHQNARKDVVAVTDASGRVVEKRTYDDFGRVFDEAKTPLASSRVGVPYGFQGRRLDPETGLYYYRMRYLDVATGRFISRDPLGNWSDSLGNPYTFGDGNPVNAVDPTGLVPEYVEGVGETAKGYVAGVGNAAKGVAEFFFYSAGGLNPWAPPEFHKKREEYIEGIANLIYDPKGTLSKMHEERVERLADALDSGDLHEAGKVVGETTTDLVLTVPAVMDLVKALGSIAKLAGCTPASVARLLRSAAVAARAGATATATRLMRLAIRQLRIARAGGRARILSEMLDRATRFLEKEMAEAQRLKWLEFHREIADRIRCGTMTEAQAEQALRSGLIEEAMDDMATAAEVLDHHFPRSNPALDPIPAPKIIEGKPGVDTGGYEPAVGDPGIPVDDVWPAAKGGGPAAAPKAGGDLPPTTKTSANGGG